MCQSALKDWLPAIASHKLNFIAKKGEVIIKEGDPVTGVYFVNSGNVKVHKKWGDKELILRFANTSKIFGHRGIGNRTSFYPISATALEATSLCFVPIDFFISTIKVNHELAFKLLLFYADELQDSEKKMRELALMSVKSRLAVSLLSLSEQFGINDEGCVNIDLSRQDLAAYAGATYETVFRTMNDMVAAHLITLDGKKIRIDSTDGLQKLASESSVNA
ncbi:MAG: Crp/Fnr family transcriptional regulator [Pedobacter sp.]